MRNDTVKPNWMKPKGYLHLSPSLRINENWKSYQKKIQDPSFIQKYAFYPLMHSIIKERKYKPWLTELQFSLNTTEQHIPSATQLRRSNDLRKADFLSETLKTIF
jgi:hypothetical protein